MRLGSHHTEDSKAKIVAANIGRVPSAETRMKMSAAHAGQCQFKTITTCDLEWTAGFLEGEGTFDFSNGSQNVGKPGYSMRVGAVQVQAWPLYKLKDMFGGSISFYPSKNPRHQDQYRWSVTGPTAAGLSMTLYSLLSPQRRDQVLKKLTLWKLRPMSHKFQTHCFNGHLLSGENVSVYTVIKGKRRTCLTCQRKYRKDRQSDMNRPICKMSECGIPVFVKDVCKKHYQRYRRSLGKRA